MALFSLLSPLMGVAKTVTESVVKGRELKQELKNTEIKAKIKHQSDMAEEPCRNLPQQMINPTKNQLRKSCVTSTPASITGT